MFWPLEAAVTQKLLLDPSLQVVVLQGPGLSARVDYELHVRKVPCDVLKEAPLLLAHPRSADLGCVVGDLDNVDSSLLLRSFDHAGRNSQPEGCEVLRYLALESHVETAHLCGLLVLLLLDPPPPLVDLILLLRDEELRVQAN